MSRKNSFISSSAKRKEFAMHYLQPQTFQIDSKLFQSSFLDQNSQPSFFPSPSSENYRQNQSNTPILIQANSY